MMVMIMIGRIYGSYLNLIDCDYSCFVMVMMMMMLVVLVVRHVWFSVGKGKVHDSLDIHKIIQSTTK